MTEFNVAELAEQLRLSTRQVQRIIKSKFHKTPQKFLKTNRLFKAVEIMINDPNTILKEIARLSGYRVIAMHSTEAGHFLNMVAIVINGLCLQLILILQSLAGFPHFPMRNNLQ